MTQPTEAAHEEGSWLGNSIPVNSDRSSATRISHGGGDSVERCRSCGNDIDGNDTYLNGFSVGYAHGYADRNPYRNTDRESNSYSDGYTDGYADGYRTGRRIGLHGTRFNGDRSQLNDEQPDANVQ